ncbi:MAG: phosphotriesterase [Candidatus Sumerlaeia bacterium]|nr:phosphotriesterase [Candidatus Sumerlaeia bacterium]
MQRRKFFQTAAGVAVLAGAGKAKSAAAKTHILTVRGAVPAGDMGVALTHEHVLVDFIGADKASRDRYNPDEVVEVVLPHLHHARQLGVQTLVECTPAFLGRDPLLLKRLSETSGLHILTNTGYYGAAGDKFVPAHAFAETADQLAARWTADWRDGIEGTGIRPGFIKIGVDAGPLSDLDRKLVRAAAKTHRATGLVIASHTGNGVAALAQLDVLKEEGVGGEAFIWVHAQNERSADVHETAARAGAWLSFDGISPKSVERHVAAVVEMKKRGWLNRVLISHDAGWYRVGEPRGGNFRPFDTLFRQFIPAAKSAGLNDDDIARLIRANPREAFAVAWASRP